MKEFSWTRIVVCGVLVGGVWTLLSVALLSVAGGEFLTAVRERQSANGGSSGSPLLLILANVGAGVWGMWLYVALRPRYGAGLKSAVRAGIAWWVIVSLQSAKWAMLLSISTAAGLAPLAAATLVAIVLATLAGAWVYEK